MTLQSNISAAFTRIASEFNALISSIPAVEYLDPATAQASLTYALPSSPADGDRIEIHFGGTISHGETVASSFNFTGGSVRGVFPREVMSGDMVQLVYADNSVWDFAYKPAVSGLSGP